MKLPVTSPQIAVRRFKKAHCGVAACGARRRTERGVLRVVHRGFTSLELLIALSLLMLLAVAATPIYSNFYVDTQHRQSQVQIVSVLRLAQQFSQGRMEDSTYGVYIDIQPGADSLVLYQGDTYATRTTAFDRIYAIDEAVALSTTFMGNEVHFDAHGLPSESGIITLTHATQGIRTIAINALGRIDE